MEGFAASLPADKKAILDETMKSWYDMMRSPKFRVTEWKGYRFMPGFEAATAKYVYEEWEGPSDHDVIVIAFPKTGTNWTHEVIRQILYKHSPEEEKTSRAIPPPMLGLEAGPAIKYELWNDISLLRRAFFTHLPRELFNNEKIKKSKLIYVARNPKDQMVSFYHFVRQISGIEDPAFRDNFSTDWADFFTSSIECRHFLETKEGEGYMEHLLGWYKTVMEDDNKMFIFYEDMKKDLLAAVRKLSHFIGIRLSEDEVASISSSCDIDSMKRRSEAVETEFNKIQNELKMFRKGMVGDWKNYFTVAQSEMMDAILERKIGHFGIKFTYEL